MKIDCIIDLILQHHIYSREYLEECNYEELLSILKETLEVFIIK